MRSTSYESQDAFEKAVSGAATVVTHLVGSGFDADLWAGDAEAIGRSPVLVSHGALGSVQADPAIDIEAVAGRIRQKGGGGALVIVTGVADRPSSACNSFLPATIRRPS